MSEVLPMGKFSFVAENEVLSFDLDSTKKFDDYGYILEVDLKYPVHLHDAHSGYPLAAQILQITKGVLSAYSSSLTSNHVNPDKLSTNLCDKTNYVIHYKNFRLYLKHGLQQINVNRILKFRHSAWIK